MDNFIAGFAYGTSSVIVGQPLDTIKTRMQALTNSNTSHNVKVSAPTSLSTARDIIRSEGIFGLYRGGLPLVFGGALIRSAQFGINESAIKYLRENFGKVQAEDRIFGIFDWQVVVAGFAGGIGRGLVEGPFEFIKTRRQVDRAWSIKEIFSGSGATVFRNSFLFSSFMIYVDISKQLVPGGLGPFWTGAICANLAWLTIWPLDVVKSQMQSGNYQGQSFAKLLVDNIRTGAMFRGIVPGLSRSFIANGCSMVVYNKVLQLLKERRE